MPDTQNDPDRRCKELQAEFFSNRELIIAANRGPVVFDRAGDGQLSWQRNAGGGLVTALLGLCQYTQTTWVACAQTEADRTWQYGDVNLSNNGNSIRVSFISPSAEAYNSYYNTISNPLLWFLQHSMWDVPRSPVINRDTWQAWEEGYVPVNQLFAKAIAQQTQEADRTTLVMLQDYHLYLTGRFLRKLWTKQAQKNTLMHFIHIPWPGPEYWSILPPGANSGGL